MKRVSTVRIVVIVLFSVMPAVLALTFDSSLTSLIHARLLAGLGLAYFLTDRFFATTRTKYEDLPNSSSLTNDASHKLQEDIDTIDNRLNLMWTVSMVCRFLQAIIFAFLITLDRQSALYFSLAIAGYLTLGLSLYLTVFFWLNSIQAVKYRRWFKQMDRDETLRQNSLKDFEPREWVKN